MIKLSLEECLTKLQEVTDKVSKEALDQVEKAAADNQGDTTKGIDYVALDVPLFVRLLEFAREDAKSDLDLHVVTENILRIQQGKNESNQAGSFLTMQDYASIVDLNEEKPQATEKEEEIDNSSAEKEEKADDKEEDEGDKND